MVKKMFLYALLHDFLDSLNEKTGGSKLASRAIFFYTGIIVALSIDQEIVSFARRYYKD